MHQESERNGLEIAVVGMSGRFPGANNIHDFWENLKNGVNSIRFFTKEEILEKSEIPPEVVEDPNFVGAKGIIENPEYFDAHFFGYSPTEAEILDPQIRIFYEICWEALEDAGCDPSTYHGAIGVYAGATSNRWWEVLTLLSGKTQVVGAFASDYLIDKDFLATRMAYKFDLKGPAVTMHTACSTGLVAVDLACRALLTGQCDAALAGGMSLLSSGAKAGGYTYEEGMIRSPDGFVRAFDEKAKGVVFSDGGAAVLVKRLDDAIEDGDHIYAVIKGFATNNDGIGKSSFSAPAIDGQAAVIRQAIYNSEVDPETITYMETHGTGTEIGDPIEIEALRIAYNTEKRNYCAIGSVKTNIGHLDTGAGIASFIKVSLTLRHRLIPPSLNFSKPNPKIDWEHCPFFVNTQLREWKNNGAPLRAGISSFGVGGTNAHMVLEEAPPREPSSESRELQLLLLSARNARALEQTSRNFLEFLKNHPEVNLADTAFTLKAGRKAFEHRRMLLCSDTREAVQTLESFLNESTSQESAPNTAVQTHLSREEKRPIFMFPGQGSQYIDMARGVYENEPVFREEMDRCFEILTPLMGQDVKEILYPAAVSPESSNLENENPAETEKINQTEITQPVIFAIEYALAKLLMAWGIMPYAMIGHSIGEYVAAALAGVFSLEDALTIVTWRGRLMQQMPTGSMLSVTLPEKELKTLIIRDAEGKLDLAAVNGPGQCVVSGTHEDIDAFAKKMESKGIQVRKLHTSHAYHSKMMEPILTAFHEKVTQVTLTPPQIPIISNISGKWLTPQDAVDPNYWVRHLRGAVRFADGLSELFNEKYSIFIEVGPGRTLSTFVRQHPGKQPEQMLVNLIRHPKEEISDTYYLLSKLGQIWIYGTSIDWKGFYNQESRHRIQLPSYPFQRTHYWVEGSPLELMGKGMAGQILLNKRSNIGEWFYIPSWKRSVISTVQAAETSPLYNWLVFIGDGDISTKLTAKLKQNNIGENRVTLVKPNNKKDTPVHVVKAAEEENTYILDHTQDTAFEALVEELHKQGQMPDRILFLWNLDPAPAATSAPDKETVRQSLDLGFYSLIYLAQALAKKESDRKIEITVITNDMQEVVGNEQVNPAKSTILGPVMIIPREITNYKCRCIDISLPRSEQEEKHILERLIKELAAEIVEQENVIAYRGKYRLVREFESAPLNTPEPVEPGSTPPRLRKQGVYLITGGLGGIGLVIARHLAKTLQARLILTGRSAIPARAEWRQWLDSHDSLDATSQKIRKVRELEDLGAEVALYSVDAADEPGMSNIVAETLERFGTINGVVHAAGLPGGGLIQLKTREIADKVLTPKILGTVALNNALAGLELDFFLLCSSINAVLPVLGQVDYYAANAFMDAFAFYKNTVEKTFTVSINWDGWQEVGMAVEAAKQQAGDQYTRHFLMKPFSHPLFDHYRPGVYTSYFRFDRHWVLSEHMTAEKKGLAPGVTYLEMARAAFHNHEEGEDGIIEIRDVSFLNPLIVEPGQEKEVRTLLKSKGDHYEFHVKSRGGAGDNLWQQHARGEIAFAARQQEKAAAHDLEAIKQKCGLEKIDVDDQGKKKEGGGLVIFGPRWRNTKTVYLGNNQALAFIELAPEFTAELDQFKLYPAMLDNAAAFLFPHANPHSAYIPFSYKKLTIYAPFPGRIYSYSRLAQPENAGKELLKFNVTIMDEQGNELVDIEEFTMLEISKDIMGRLKDKEQGAAPANRPSTGTPAVMEAAADEDAGLKGLVKDGIAPMEGIEALTRILAENQPQVVVSTRDLIGRIKATYSTQGPTSIVQQLREKVGKGGVHSRPEISAQYVAPANNFQQKLADLWEDILGIEQIGIDDDFFELGGDSLKATIMISRIKNTFNSEISIKDIFGTPRIRDLAKQLGKDEAGEHLPTMTLYPVEKKEYYPLSEIQKRLYILNSMEGISTAYNLPFAVKAEGNPDWQVIENAFQHTIQRHESFRTSFKIVGSGPVQIIHDSVDFHLEYYQLENSQHDSATSAELEILMQRFLRPYDLASAPLVRIGIVKASPGKNFIILDTHHIISDGTSYPVILKDLFALMAEQELPPLKIQYKDYTEWQHSEPGRLILKKQEEFWLDQFKGNIPVLDMFTDYPRPDVQSFTGDAINFKLDTELTHGLETLVKETRTTLYMVLLAAFTIMISRFSGQEDIVVGSPVAAREHPDLEKLVGIFINTLPMRNFPESRKTFAAFLEEVKENSIKAFDHQSYPFGQLIEKLDLVHDISRNPLYDVELIVQNMLAPFQGGGGGEIKLSPHRLVPKAIQLDITFEAVDIAEEITFEAKYCTQLFKPETILHFIDFFKQIISTVIKDKEIKLEDIKVPHTLEKAKLNVPQAEEIKFGF